MLPQEVLVVVAVAVVAKLEVVGRSLGELWKVGLGSDMGDG